VATGILSGQSTKAIACDANTSQRSVQRIAAEPETQFLITEAFRPYRAQLEEMAGMTIDAIEKALGAMKTDKQDHTSRLRAVERYGEVLVLAQGKVVEKPVHAGIPSLTWDEYVAMYNARTISSECV